jgi:preprotein translocase subunit SecG
MTTFFVLTILFAIVAMIMTVIILAQRPQGGGLAGAFGGAGGSGDSVFGGRIGDALTWATVITFTIFIGLAIALNRVDNPGAAAITPTVTGQPLSLPADGAPTPGGAGGGAPAAPGAGSAPPVSPPPVGGE